MVPYVELPPATPPTDHVTAVFVALETVAVNWKVCPTVKDEGADPKTILTAGEVVVGVVAIPAEGQPTITTSRLKLIPTTHALRCRPRIVDPAPIKPEVRIDTFDIKHT
jgi:hypothetical protein